MSSPVTSPVRTSLPPLVQDAERTDSTHRFEHVPFARHSTIALGRYLGTQWLGASFPVTAGVLVLGWRALGAIGLVLAAASAGLAAWRRIGWRGSQLRYDYALTMALLLALCLPAEWCDFGKTGAVPHWPLLLVCGISLALTLWLLGGVGSGRVHPILPVIGLLLACGFGSALQPIRVLQRQHLFWGDVRRADAAPAAGTITVPWIRAELDHSGDALMRTPAAQTLLAFTTGGGGRLGRAPQQAHAWTSLDTLLRDQLPPLEDLIIAGNPAPIGSASIIFVIVGGLFLLYCGVIDVRVPLTIVVAALVALLVLPVPVVIRENEAVFRWLVLRPSAAGWRVALTLANYELMAGPLMFVAFFLATAPAVRPITRGARSIYAITLGAGAAAAQLYISVSFGAYLALFGAGLLTLLLERMVKARTLV